MPFDLQDDEQRRVFKDVLRDAIDDWLNKQFTAFEVVLPRIPSLSVSSPTTTSQLMG